VLITTTSYVEGRSVSAYLGVIAGEAAAAGERKGDFVSELFGSGTSTPPNLRQAREAAFANLTAAAEGLEADAVIGTSLHYQALGSDNRVLVVSVSGTAVKLA